MMSWQNILKERDCKTDLNNKMEELIKEGYFVSPGYENLKQSSACIVLSLIRRWQNNPNTPFKFKNIVQTSEYLKIPQTDRILFYVEIPDEERLEITGPHELYLEGYDYRRDYGKDPGGVGIFDNSSFIGDNSSFNRVRRG